MKPIRIVYVGLKEMKADNVAGTGLVWTRGEIHEIEDEAKAAKLLAHPLIWQDADTKYELVPEPAVVKPEPRVNFVPSDSDTPYWEPIVITIPSEVFNRLQKKELVSTFMTPADADAYASWKLAQQSGVDTSPRETGPSIDASKMDKRSKEYKEWVSRQGLEAGPKKAA